MPAESTRDDVNAAGRIGWTLTQAAARTLSAPRWTLLLSVVVVLAIASGMRLLTMNSDYKVFFSKDNPQVAAFEDLQATYTKDDNILIGLEPVGGTVFTPRVLSAIDTAIRWLARAFRRTRGRPPNTFFSTRCRCRTGST